MPEKIIITKPAGLDISDEDIDQIASDFELGNIPLAIRGQTIDVEMPSGLTLTNEEINTIAHTFKNRLIQSITINSGGGPLEVLKRIKPGE